MSRPLSSLCFTIVLITLFTGTAKTSQDGLSAPYCPRADIDFAVEAPLEGIDIGHILCGDINGRGEGSGYHFRAGGKDPATAKINGVSAQNPDTGVYISNKVEIWNGASWVEKKNISSFFPHHCSARGVLNSIAFAASKGTCRFSSGKWGGPSGPQSQKHEQYCYGKDGSVLTIHGYFRTGTKKIATAWPLINAKSGNCVSAKQE